MQPQNTKQTTEMPEVLRCHDVFAWELEEIAERVTSYVKWGDGFIGRFKDSGTIIYTNF